MRRQEEHAKELMGDYFLISLLGQSLLIDRYPNNGVDDGSIPILCLFFLL